MGGKKRRIRKMGEIKYPTPTVLPDTVGLIDQTIAFRGRELIGPFELSEPPRVKNFYTRLLPMRGM